MDSGSTWSLHVYIRLCCWQLSSLLERSLQSGPVPLAAFEPWLTYIYMGVVTGDSYDVFCSGSYTQGWL